MVKAVRAVVGILTGVVASLSGAVGQLSSARNITFLANLKLPYFLNDVWGYYDSVSGKEYALVGTEAGVYIVDVSAPVAPDTLFFIAGPVSIWRDIKTWQHYMYIVHDQLSDTTDTPVGLTIVRLDSLPRTIFVYTWDFNDTILTAHNIWIDDSGYIYFFGAAGAHGSGMFIANLKDNPLRPHIVGVYTDAYVHDGYVLADTLYAAEIYAGRFSIVDVSRRDSPVRLVSVPTPYAFSHNVWVSPDGRYLFNTDERVGAPVTAYRVSPRDSIRELDRFFSPHSSGVIPHNVVYRDGWLIISYYRDGVLVVDAHRPHNLVEVGWYDTSPLAGAGFNGCWGVYPFLPSGVILASDIEEGLFVLRPEYVRAGYVEGVVRDSATSAPLTGVQVELVGTGITTFTDAEGFYALGSADTGVYEVRFWRVGCDTLVVGGVEVRRGQVVRVDTMLRCWGVVSVMPEGLSKEKKMWVVGEKQKVVVGGGGRLRVEVQDVTGRPIAYGEGDSKVAVGVPGAGLYLVRVCGADGCVQKRVVVW